MAEQKTRTLNIEDLLKPDGPVSIVIQAEMETVGERDTFQPAGFPQIGHIIYKAPRKDNNGHWTEEPVCIVDSPASMANHLESVCLADAAGIELHPDLKGMPYVICVTDDQGKNQYRPVTSTLQEGHRLASDYFVDKDHARKVDENRSSDKWRPFRHVLREQFGLHEIQKDKTYFVYPDNWWSIFSTIFSYDPNSLVHGVLFAKEQIKVSRMLSPHMEAFGASRVRGSGVKFDPLGKTASGQPIFATDVETAHNIRATFILDLALLRSYGRRKEDGKNEWFGLNDKQKQMLLELALWKINQLLSRPFKFRSGCFLQCASIKVSDEQGDYPSKLPTLDIRSALDACNFKKDTNNTTRVYYPVNVLFTVKEEEQQASPDSDEQNNEEGEEASED